MLYVPKLYSPKKYISNSFQMLFEIYFKFISNPKLEIHCFDTFRFVSDSLEKWTDSLKNEAKFDDNPLNSKISICVGLTNHFLKGVPTTKQL